LGELFETDHYLNYVEYSGGHKLFDAVNKPIALLWFWLSMLSLFLTASGTVLFVTAGG